MHVKAIYARVQICWSSGLKRKIITSQVLFLTTLPRSLLARLVQMPPFHYSFLADFPRNHVFSRPTDSALGDRVAIN